jgi:hypothetical protein
LRGKEIGEAISAERVKRLEAMRSGK